MKGINYFIFIVLCICTTHLYAQDSASVNGYQIYKYPSGKIASEGIMRDGKPDGYWKTYYENGKLKTEGNRFNFELDSVWKFYDPQGKLNLSIDYKKGVYNGRRITWLKDRILVDSFANGLKEGSCFELNNDSTIYKSINYKNGIEDGLAKTYSKEGRLIGLSNYRNGFLIRQESFNYYDDLGNKQGIWKEFYPDFTLKSEGFYRNNIKHGYFKTFDSEGKLILISKYAEGVELKEVAELAQLEIRTDYYENGNVKTIGSYKNNSAEGVRREYSIDGKIIAAFILQEGKVISKGIIDEQGVRQGPWQDYYFEGNILAEGLYEKGLKVGVWKYYHFNGKLEQEGAYDKNGYSTGTWKWYYSNGNLRREEFFFEGVSEGEMIEYDTKQNVMLKGKYVDGIQEGLWLMNVHGYREEGEYLDGVKEGNWIFYYPNGQKYFEGIFIDDNPDGKHIFYNKNETTLSSGNYIMGLKEGVWHYNDEEGNTLLLITYKDGIEIEYNSVKIGAEQSPNLK